MLIITDMVCVLTRRFLPWNELIEQTTFRLGGGERGGRGEGKQGENEGVCVCVCE